MKEMKESLEQNQFSFKPVTNTSSKRLNSAQSAQNLTGENVADRLMSWGNQKQKNAKLLSEYNKKIKASKELDDCTFKPKLRRDWSKKNLVK